MRIGIFGGTFDPVHQGHLILAEQCRDQGQLDQVWFVPCASNPLKTEAPGASDRQRVEMLQLAITGHESFRLSRLELDREGPSYTVETLEAISQSQPHDELLLLMGADSLETFKNWKQPERICELATPLVVGRPGFNVDLSQLQPWLDEARFQQVVQQQIQSPLIEISSTELRRRAGDGQTIRYLTPRSVEKYIQTQSVYQA